MKFFLLHFGFMENKYLVKIQKHVDQSKLIHNKFLSEVSHNWNPELCHQNWSDLVDKNLLIFIARLTGSYIFGYLNVTFLPVGS